MTSVDSCGTPASEKSCSVKPLNILVRDSAKPEKAMQAMKSISVQNP